MKSGLNEAALYWPCPVEGCDWKFKAEPVERERYVIEDPTSKGVADAVADASRRRAAEIDQELRAHLESHDVLDFVRTIARLKQDLAQQDSGIRPHIFPRDFRAWQ